MGIFPHMQPFVMGDKKLKQPFRSSLCACTCVDIAVASAIMKLTGQMPEINPQTCTISLPKIKVIPSKKKKKPNLKPTAAKPKLRVNCNSVVNFLKGGLNERRLEEQKTRPKGAKDPLLEGLDLSKEFMSMPSETADSVYKAHGSKLPRIYFLKEPKNFKFGADLQNLISYFEGKNIGLHGEVVKLEPYQGAVCFLEFAVKNQLDEVLRSHACILCGYGPDDEGVMFFDVYNPEIVYLGEESFIITQNGEQTECGQTWQTRRKC